MSDTPKLPHLRARVLQAGYWTVLGHVADTLIRLGTSLILTRLLAPEDFGLATVAIAIPVGLAMLSDVGTRSNVIMKSGDLGPDFLTTAWTIQAIRGLLLWGVTLLVAALLNLPQVQYAIPPNSLFSHNDLPLVLAIMGSTVAISGFESINTHVMERDINLRPLIFRLLLSKIAPIPVMLTWAMLYPTVWSLVAGAIVSQTVLTLSSHTLIPGTPMKFFWSPQHARNLLFNGKWITLSSASGFLANQGDRLILATLLTASQMGLYAIAWTLISVPQSLLQRVHGQITLPILSELFRTRPSAAIEVYYKYRKPIDVLTFVTIGFLWVASPVIIDFLYDDRYLEAGKMLKILSLSLASFPFLMINMCFIANNEWSSFSINSILLSISIFLALYLGYYLSGWTGALWGLALHSWPATLILLARAYRRGWIKPRLEVTMVPTVLIGVALGFAAQKIFGWIGAMF